MTALVADQLGIAEEDVFVASTGVIGRQYPMDKIRSHLANLSAPFSGTDAAVCAQAAAYPLFVPAPPASFRGP